MRFIPHCIGVSPISNGDTTAGMEGRIWSSARRKKKITATYDAHDGEASMTLVKIDDVLRTMVRSHMLSKRYAFHSQERSKNSHVLDHIEGWVLVKVLFNYMGYHYCCCYIKESCMHGVLVLGITFTT